MENKYIVVTGGAGSIGQELVRQLAPKNWVFILDNNETAFFDLYEELNQKGIRVYGVVGDIRNFDFNSIVSSEWPVICPDYIFHCAALKHVTPSKWSPRDYIETNILGTLNVLNFAKRQPATKIINISTDKVINANSIMGATKKVAEILTKDANHISVRFGNVLGSRGSVVPIWQRQMDKNEPLTITDSKMTRYIMTVSEACELVIEAAKIGESGDILVMDMGEKINIEDLAKQILKKAGKSDDYTRVIGIRPGETLTEELMTENEKSRAIRKGKFWIIK